MFDDPDAFPYMFTAIFFIAVFVTSMCNPRLKKIPIITVASVVILLILLERKFALRVEKGEKDDPVRLNTDMFHTHPFRALREYINSVKYYNNLWRIAMICACTITLFLYSFTRIKPSLFPFVILAMFVFVYHILHFKIHHTFDFVFRSVDRACLHMEQTGVESALPSPPEKHEQEVHT